MVLTKLAPLGAALALALALNSTNVATVAAHDADEKAVHEAGEKGETVSKLKPHEKTSGFPVSKEFSPLITKYAKAYGVPVNLAHAVVRVESNFRPHVTGRAGEVGLMQIKHATAQMMGYKGSRKALYSPENNIKFGMKYLAKAHQLGGGSTCGTILKYNAGHGAKSMNPVSKNYCRKVQGFLN